jgi:2,4-dienoyl-CoA reductase-like NADH-dependent reductase (Old Yellow Enzyme family)/NADPH-dependent 2,4-dienoyl-CoA reductase/sulfur reductase-like enzyme
MLLKEPGLIGAMRLKNRIIMAPMGTNYGTTDGFATDRDKRYYAERARGGVAMIVTEAMNISPGARNHNNSLCVFHDAFIPGLRSVVDAVKAHGVHAVGQLNHRGQLLRRSVLGMEPVGPTAGTSPATGEPVRALRVDEIRALERDFLESARRLRTAGYDAVEIHAANGYLFHQFFSPRFNRRADAYGGSVENRMRFLIETVDLILDHLPDFPVMVRVSATEYVDDGYSEDEVIALLQALERAGVVAIDLSGGSNETPFLSRYCIQPPSFPRRCLEPYARRLKSRLRIPVIVAGRIITPEDAEAILQAESADFISLGRALIADPHWCLKAFGEVDAPIRPCISCNVCLERLSLERDVACVQNPLVGTEFETLEALEPQLAPREPGARKRVLVLGAGVSGAEAARVTAAQGHVVEIWEKAAVAGGQMPLAVAAPDKAEVSGVWSYRIDELNRLGVRIRLAAVVTSKAIREFAPDVVFVATGARPRSLPQTLAVGVPIVQAWDVLLNPEVIGSATAVTIIGGGIVGLETADLLAARGCRVTILEMSDSVASEMARNNRFEVLARLERRQARILTGTRVESAADGRLVVGQRDVEFEIDPGDVVIAAIGPEPNRDVLPEIEAAGVPYVLVGDCNRPGDFLTAIRDASMAALAVGSGQQH